MAGALTTFAEQQALKFLIAADNQTGSGHQQGAAAVGPVLPLMVRLCTKLGTEDLAGDEVVASGTSTYTAQPVTFTELQSDNTVANENIVRFNNMPDIPYDESNPTEGGVRAFEIWDSAETPVRWWYALLTTTRGYAAGDAAEFPAKELILAID